MLMHADWPYDDFGLGHKQIFALTWTATVQVSVLFNQNIP